MIGLLRVVIVLVLVSTGCRANVRTPPGHAAPPAAAAVREPVVPPAGPEPRVAYRDDLDPRGAGLDRSPPGGTKHNVIPDQVTLQLTVRSFTTDVRRTLLDGIAQLTTDVCTAFRCPRPPLVVVKDEHTPAAYNDPALTAAAAGLFRTAFGGTAVVERRPEMGGEDFGRYAIAAGVPGFMFRLGSVAPAALAASRRPGGPALPGLHSSRYAPVPVPTLATGVRAMAHLVLGLMGSAS
jgi:metal-dependent amidase/aminoacylase/carboxypeptidase family protein